MADFVIIGAGPAGLTAACELALQPDLAPSPGGVTLASSQDQPSVLLLERDSVVGGLSRTVEHHGFRCDIGGHRFFTKSHYVDRLWHQILGDDFLRRPRLSRIYYRGRFFRYPLRIRNALANLGLGPSLAVIGSFLAAKLRPKQPARTFAEWVSQRFGRRLFEMFFRTYTEKVWGLSCDQLSADWAAQRIRNLSLGKAIFKALGLTGRQAAASLIEEFDYPVYGPGQMYDRMADLAIQRGAQLELNSQVTRIEHTDTAVTAVWVESVCEKASSPLRFPVTHACFSSMPLDELIGAMDPPPPDAVRQAAAGLRYRSLLTVNVLLHAPTPLPDTWIYIHDPAVTAGRLQLYGNWSPRMTPSPTESVIGLEYFATEGDELWNKSDPELFQVADHDLRRMNLIDQSKVFDHFAVRYRKAYPVYDEGYAQRIKIIRDWLRPLANLYPIGRYGQFRYNNMDHSILTAHYAVEAAKGRPMDPWSVNVEQEHVEDD